MLIIIIAVRLQWQYLTNKFSSSENFSFISQFLVYDSIRRSSKLKYLCFKSIEDSLQFSAKWS